MITSFKIKNVATYDSLNGVALNDLKKINFFFGFNGSGKSTIAKYFRNLSLDAANQNPSFFQCTNIGYDNSQNQILTFNEEFIEDNFKKNSDFKGVFSLNQSNAAIDLQIINEESNTHIYETVRSKYEVRINEIEADKRAKSDFTLNHCWSQRPTFSTFTRITLAHAGSKPNHLQEIKRILNNPLSQVLTIQELTEQANLVLIDNRGTGRSKKEKVTEHFTVEIFARDTSEVLEQFGQKYHLAGLSRGGCVAQAVAHMKPNLLTSLS